MRVHYYIVLAFTLILPLRSQATHLRAADILVEQECNSLRYKITVRVYLNTLSGTPFGGFNATDGHLNFGDGSALEIILPQNIVGPTLRPDLGPDISVASYTTFHRFSRPGFYKVTYFERDRSGGILNISNSHDVAYSTFVMIKAQTEHCNKLPVLQVAPVDRGCKGVVFYHSAGATDSDGDSLSYEMTIPSKDSLSFVDGFRQPDAAVFYNDFAHGNEAGTGPPSFGIDPVTGLITWDAPGLQGEYNIAFKIIEWRFDPGSQSYFVISISIRDMQIIIEDCFNARPTLTGPADVCVEAGKTVTATFVGRDAENHPVKIEVFSSIFEGGPGNFPATYDPQTTDFRPSDPPAELHIEWKTNCVHVRDQVYQVVVKITDNPTNGPRLVTFTTWNIKVIAPAPSWKSTEPDLVNRSAVLEWEDYSCMNAEKIQLWRKVGSFPFLPGPCVAGLAVTKGYTLIEEFDPDVTSFTDTNDGKKLSVGAQYCYRLVAVFPLPKGGKSYVSTEVCVGPILADAPVITNVSVITTRKSGGEIEVRWTKPFEISAEQYPEPYEYEVYRSGGFFLSENAQNISGRLTNVTHFTDGTANTMDSVYNYTVVLYSKTMNNPEYNAIDTSSTASSVRLLLEPGDGKITLRWSAEVPWSNVVQERPYHRIYRGVAGDEKEDLVLIDSVEVSETGFEYIDVGAYKNQPINPGIFYCYYAQTVGSYGNAMIPVLMNDSQMASTYPINNLPLCSPVINVAKTDCATFLAQTGCEETHFENLVDWLMPTDNGCRRDAVSYNLYYSDVIDGEYTLLKSFTDQTVFNDEVSMLSRCYKMSAVDIDGSESPLSEPSCNENCYYFELPNVFTPNNDGCNDLFSSYLPNGENTPCESVHALECPRFVKSVSLRILNRWGRLVYDQRSEAANAAGISWNGRDTNGTLLDPGIYYYTADVEFYSIDPASTRKSLKGWISLVR